MNNANQKSLARSLRNPFSTPSVTVRGFVTASVAAVAYAALFSVAIARNEVPVSPVSPVSVASAVEPFDVANR